MANNRRSGGGGGQFDMSFNRRQQQQGNNNMDMQSLLGSPPTRQQQNMNQTGYQSFASFEQSYSRRMDNKGNNDDYFGGGGNFNSGGGQNNNSGYGNNDFGPRGGGGNVGNQQQFQQGRGSNNQFGGQSGGGNNGVWNNKQNSSPQGMRGGGQDAWSRSGGQGGGGGFDDSMMMRGQGMGQGSNIGQSSDQQQVVMVVPQGNAGGGGIMGMVPVQGTPNPFMMQRQQQQPMQVIVGNLPGLNADAFGQQILAAASARPQYGQGGMPMGGPQMGMGNQRQQQQQQRYDRSIVDGGGDGRRFSARQANGSQHNRSPGRSAAVNRRSDLSNSGNSANKALNRGPTNNSSAITRGNRKRTVLRDRHGVADEVDRKRPKTTVPAKAAGVQQKNLGNKGKGNKQQQRKRAAELRAAAAAAKKEGAAKKDEAKKEGDEAKADDAVEETKADEKTGEGESTEKKESKYDEFPNAFLVCKICQKVMSDGSSFESHLNGRAHVALVKMLESRFQKRAELLMFESKLSEEEIGIEMDRQRRAGKPGHGGKGSKNYCKMCDGNYAVNWGTHKVSIGHRVLKEYLHPTCRYCSTNFVHRMDWVNHLHSLPHLRKLKELKEAGADVEDQESSSQDELFAINLEIGKEEHVTPVLVIRSTDYKAPTKEDLKEMLKDEKGEIALPEGEIEIPKEFVENQAYGEEAITNVEGACCKVCRTYIGNRNDVDAHVKSKPHYGMYVSYLKKVVKYRENLKAAKEKAEKEAIEKAEREKKKAEEEAAAAAAAALKIEEDALKKEQETPMETETVETPKKDDEAKSDAVVESTTAKVEPTPPAPVVAETKEVVPEAGGDVAVVDESKKTDADAPKPAAAVETETPKKDPAPTPAKSAPNRGRGGPRGGNRGGARGRGSPAGGRGRGSPGRGSPRGGGNLRGTPRGGGSNWNNNRGGRGQARGRPYQR